MHTRVFSQTSIAHRTTAVITTPLSLNDSSETTTTQGASKPSAKGPQRGNLEEEGGEKLAYEELADENGRGKLPQQNQPSPSSGAQETDSRNYVKTKPDCGHDDGEDDLVEKVKEPGVWGPDGLLAIRHVKMVLFLASAVQVKKSKVERWCPGIGIAYTIYQK